MEEHFDINLTLRVYHKVASHGEKTGDKYQFQGLTAWSDADGYTVELSDSHVSLSIYFHNKYEFKYDNAKQLETFIRHLELVDSMKQ